jgi:rubrerythrin
MSKKPMSLTILLGAPKKESMPVKGDRASSLQKLNKMAMSEAASRQGEDAGEGEGTDWTCPDCGTVVMATMKKDSMECPCCGCEMKMDDEGEESEGESEYSEEA